MSGQRAGLYHSARVLLRCTHCVAARRFAPNAIAADAAERPGLSCAAVSAGVNDHHDHVVYCHHDVTAPA